jgi:hypothetical protein
MNNPSFFYYGLICFSLTLLGLLLTVIEFRRTSLRKNPIPQRMHLPRRAEHSSRSLRLGTDIFAIAFPYGRPYGGETRGIIWINVEIYGGC